MSKQVKVTLIKSMIGKQEKLRKVIIGMGLSKINRSKIFTDSPSIRGMIQKVSHMVKVEEIINENS
ncbi:MAG: 50S ribosomal protein L30 [Desulfobacterales bacterium]|nr:50S ribosomal protein L30 [Desulfobacterales bacterium]